MKKLLISMIILFCVVTLFVPNTYSREVDENNTPIGESVKPFEANKNNTTLDEPVINAETFLFPDIGDTRFTLSGSNFWNDGDFVEGMRLLASPSYSIEMILEITGALTCDTQDHAIMIDGTTIGNFSIGMGDTQVVQSFSFPVIAAGYHTIRIETVRTVNPTCGSAGFPDGVSTLNFGSSACTNNVALSYTGGTLSMDFTVGSTTPATWNVFLSYHNTILPLSSMPIPAIVPPITIPATLQVPSIGGIGVLTTLTTPGDGIICSDWQTVDTGP